MAIRNRLTERLEIEHPALTPWRGNMRRRGSGGISTLRPSSPARPAGLSTTCQRPGRSLPALSRRRSGC